MVWPDKRELLVSEAGAGQNWPGWEEFQTDSCLHHMQVKNLNIQKQPKKGQTQGRGLKNLNLKNVPEELQFSFFLGDMDILT